MTLLQLKYISTVAKCGSFSKAAQVLYVSQPGISKMVCALEEELGITIFVRSAAGITLTAEGRELLNMGERLLTDAEHISQHFSQDLSKTHETLSVSSQHYCFAIDAMMAYQNTYQKESYTYKFLVGQGPEVIQQVVDKTTELGVDAVIHSLTKYIGGHGDLLGGAVISNDEQFLRECRLGTLMHFGSVMAPFTAFLVCRGLKTLGVRMKQYNESALKIAKWLEANPKIETVRYPFLESNPQYAIAKKQMKGGGGMISFDVAGGLEAGKKFINSLKLCTLAVSLGDTETLVEQAAAMTHTMIPKEIREAAGITDGMIRMSVGLEDPDDIIADLKQALGD